MESLKGKLQIKFFLTFLSNSMKGLISRAQVEVDELSTLVDVLKNFSRLSFIGGGRG